MAVRQRRRGPAIVEPVGYAVTQFVTSIALVGGIGLAPNGLLLAAAAILASVIDLRRFRARNPGVIPETQEEFDGPRGRVLMRFSIQAVVTFVVLSGLGLWFVHHDRAQAGALGPALVAGVVTLYLNWRIKTSLTRIALEEYLAHEQTARDHDDEMRAVDEREDDTVAGGAPADGAAGAPSAPGSPDTPGDGAPGEREGSCR